MKKFGFGKKSGDDGDDANRSALFGRKNKSPAPSNDNPYAQAPAGNDPYAQDNNKFAGMTPYQQARAGAPGVGAPGGLPSGPRAGGGGGYGAPAPAPAAGGYGAEKYGAASGYGANRYDNNQNAYGRPGAAAAGGARGPGGYGGLGRSDSNDTDAVRDELFSGAQDRYKQKPQAGGYGQSAVPGEDGGYGGYGAPRELTAEEQEAEEYRSTKNQIKEVRNESVQTVNRALQAAMAAEETGRATLARLGAQGERLHNTEKNLDMAANHNKVAEDRAKELKTLNRSMFAVHVNNPFTSKSRAADRDAAVLERHRQERETRESTRQDAYKSNQRLEETFRDMTLSGRPQGRSGGASAAERSRFVLQDDSDDEAAAEADAQERAIDDGLDQLSGAVGRLNGLARAQMREVDEQNVLITKIGQKSDAVDDGVRMNRERLNRIK